MNKKMLSRLTALLLALLLCLGLLLPALGAEGEKTISITTARDLTEFAKNCAYDAWSQGLRVSLERDVSLAGVNYLPAACFNGTFEGNGHVISDVNLIGSVAPAGLFGILGESGLVRNLTVEGTVSPDGDAVRVGGIVGLNRGTVTNCAFTGTVEGTHATGGIAGENTATGVIESCTVSGGVFGKERTGGVVGSSSGTVTGCTNTAYVNTNTMDPTLSLSDLDLDLRDGLRRLMSPDTYNVATDSGGIVGWSDGAVLGCRNRGSVGYQHIGYNVGGIAGRSRGNVSTCVNEGAVYGRRCVGGIVGVAEPNVILNFTESSLETVREELGGLNAVVDRAARDAEGTSATVSARLTAINEGVDAAEDRARDLTDTMTGYWDGTVDEINRGSRIVDEAIDQLKGVTRELTGASDTMTRAVDGLEDALKVLTERGKSGTSTFDELSKMAEELETGCLILNDSLDYLSRGFNGLAGVNWAGKLKSANAAMAQIKDGLRGLEDAMGKVSSGMEDISVELGEDGFPVVSAPTLVSAFDEASDAVGEIRRGVETFQGLSDGEIDQADAGLAMLRAGLNILADGRDGQDEGGAFYYFALASSRIWRISEDGQEAVEQLEGALDVLKDASSQMTEALRGADSLVGWLQNQDRLTFSSLGEAADASADALYDSLHSISGQLEQLNGEAKAGSDQLSEDIRRINDQFTRVMNTLLDVVEEAENASASDTVEDTSEEDIDAVIQGKVFRSTNSGTVAGDIDVGGVAGAMEVYDDSNPEGDEKTTLSSLFRRRYQLKCVLQNCVNSGEVTGKRNHVGAVCGDGQLGIISGCEGYGTVKSDGGDYVGGVAGHADNVIRNSYAKCSLSGRAKVGGILGGAGEDSSCRVENCVSLVEIADCTQHGGAIAGTDEGTFKGNLFVSDELAGLDRVSYRGQAQPISYGELLELSGLPARFRIFTLTFQAGDRVVRTLRFHYGDSLDETAFPAIPQREGEYGRWDREDLSDLRFDTTVTAEYFPNVTALPSAITRSASRPVFFAEGGFDDTARLNADPEILAFDPGQEGFWDTLRSYHRTILEQWRVECPDDGADAHVLRYLPPEGGTGSVAVYLSTDGGDTWTRQETGQAGSYLTFSIPTAGADMTVLSTATPWWVWGVLGVLCAGLVALLLTFLIRKKAPAKKTPDPEEGTELTEEERVAQEAARDKAQKRARVRRRIRIVILALILILGGTIFAILRFAPEVTDSMELYLLLRNYAQRPDLHMELDLTTTVGERAFSTELDLSTGECEGKRLSCLEWEDIPVYFCDGALILENGRAYGLEEAMPDYAGLLPYVAGIYRSMEVTVTDLGGVRTYHAVTQGEAAQELLGHLFPDDLTALPDTDKVGVDLALTDGEPTSLTVSWDGAAGSADARLTFLEEPGTREVPQAVRTTLRTGEYQSAPQAGEDLRRLVLALTELSAREPLTAETTLSANCGPLLLNEALTYQRTRRFDRDLSRVSRRGTGLWFTEAGACLDSGTAAGLAEAARFDSEEILRLCYRALLLGDADCSALAGGYHYVLSLDADAMARLASAIAPETADMALEFRRGTVTLNVQNGLASGLAVQCRGIVHIVQTDVPANVSAQITFDKTKLFPEVPQAVIDALELTPFAK